MLSSQLATDSSVDHHRAIHLTTGSRTAPRWKTVSLGTQTGRLSRSPNHSYSSCTECNGPPVYQLTCCSRWHI